MAFDAGHIVGHLDLDTTTFDKGFHEAHTHTEEGSAKIRELMESIAEVVNEVLGPAFAHMGQEIQSAFAGFSEGPAIGALNMAGIALGNIREASEDIGEKFDAMGLAAEKAGVPIEEFSKLAAVAGTKHIELTQLVMAFKALQQSGAGAGEDTKKAEEGFRRLGISMKEASELSAEPLKLWNLVQERLETIPNVSDRTTAALGVLGARSISIVPLLAMGREEFDKVGDHMVKLGGTMTEENAKQGETLELLKGYWGAAMMGIEKAVAVPIFEALKNHLDEIEPKLEAFSKGAVADLGKAWDYLKDNQEELLKGGQAFGTFLTNVTPLVSALAKGIVELTVDLAALAAQFASDAEGGGGPITSTERLYRNAKSVFVPGADKQDQQHPSPWRDAAEDVITPLLNPVAGITRPLLERKNAGSHPQGSVASAPSAAADLNNRVNQAAGTNSQAGNAAQPSGPVNHNYTVTVNIKPDPKQTAAELAKVIFPEVKKAQRDHDEKAAGAIAANAAASSLGGNH